MIRLLLFSALFLVNLSCGEKISNSKNLKLNILNESNFQNLLNLMQNQENTNRIIDINCLDFRYILSAKNKNGVSLFTPIDDIFTPDISKLVSIAEKNREDIVVADMIPALEINENFSLANIPDEAEISIEGFVKICLDTKEAFGQFKGTRVFTKEELESSNTFDLESYFSIVFPFVLSNEIQKKIKEKQANMNNFIPVAFSHNIQCEDIVTKEEDSYNRNSISLKSFPDTLIVDEEKHIFTTEYSSVGGYRYKFIPFNKEEIKDSTVVTSLLVDKKYHVTFTLGRSIGDGCEEGKNITREIILDKNLVFDENGERKDISMLVCDIDWKCNTGINCTNKCKAHAIEL